MGFLKNSFASINYVYFFHSLLGFMPKHSSLSFSTIFIESNYERKEVLVVNLG